MQRLAVAVLLLLASVPAFAQARCTDTCVPPSGSSTYQTNTQARADLNNARGYSNPAAPQRMVAGDVKKEPDLPGSQSYDFSAPMLHLPGRNGLDLDLTLFYNSHVWTINKANNTATFNADRDYPGYGFRLGFGYMEKLSGLGTNYILTERDGTKHKLSGPTMSSAHDGAGMAFLIASNKVIYKSGLAVTYQAFPGSTSLFRPITITDTSGNHIDIVYGTSPNMSELQIATITDTLGRVITFNYTPDNQQSPTYWLLHTITQGLSGGGTKTWATFDFKTDYVLRYTFSGLTTNNDSPSSGDTAHPQHVLWKCTYPNGSKIIFNYGPNGDWGVVTGIDRTTSDGTTIRSSITYDYPPYTVAQTDHPTYTSKTVSDAQSHSMSWGFATVMSGNKVSTSTVTNPDSTSSVTTLYTDGSASDGLTQSVVYKDTNGNALRTVNYTYSGGLPNVITTTLNGTGQQSKVVLTFDVATTTYGNLIEKDEYDYGLVLKRKTLISYLATAPYTANACRLVNRPSQILVEDANSNIIAKATFAYDGSMPTAPGTNPTQHNTATCDSGNNVRGNLTTLTRWYDIAGNLSIARTSTYDTLGNVLTAQPECCNQETIAYSSTYQGAYPTQTIVGSGVARTTKMTYDFDNGNVLSRQDFDNNLTTNYQYDSMNRLAQTTLPNGTTITPAYHDDSTNPWVTQTNSAANTAVQATHFDALGRADFSDIEDKSGNVFSRTDTIYDNMNRASQISNPHLTTETPVYTTYSYDGLGRVTTITPPGNAGSYSNSYSGNATTATDPAGKTRRSFIDALGRLIQVDEPGWGDALPGKGSVTISLGGSGSGTVTVNGLPKSTSYNAMTSTSTIANNLAAQFNTDTNSTVTASTQSNVLNFTAKTAGSGTNYSLSANASNRTFSTSGATLTGARDASGPDTATLVSPMTTTYTYNVLDDLTAVSQAAMGPVGGQQLAGQSRSYVYDALGRLKSSTTPESGQYQFTYLSSGKLDTRKDAKLAITKYCYDGLNRLQYISYANNSNCSAPDVTYTYGTTAGSVGQVASVAESSGSTTYTYSVLGFMTAASKVINGTPYVLNYNYDENATGRLNYLQYPSQRKITQKYDSIGRVWSITDTPSGGVEATRIAVNGFNAAQQPLTLLYGNSVTETLDYDPNRALVSRIRYDDPSANHLLDLGYSYANNAQILGATDNLDSTKTTAYTYDAWSRLKTAAAGAGATWSMSWDYDRFGNRLNQNGGGFGTQTTADVNTNRILTIGGTTLPAGSYDANGNLKNDLSHSYTYDQENRLTSVDTTVAQYTYDSSNLRVKKVKGGHTTVYVFSGTSVIAEYVDGALSKEFEYSGGNLLATVSGGTVTYQHPDHLSTRLETDTSGVWFRKTGHYPFGENWYDLQNGSNLQTSLAPEWKFTSYEEDSESLNNYGINRFDSERLGRFLTPDLLSGQLRSPQSLDRYSYVINQPVGLTDPTGTSNGPCMTRMGFARVCMPSTMGGNADAWGCTIDGIDSPCSFLGSGGEGYGFCPSNDCGGIDEWSGRPYQYIATTEGQGYYYSNGPGSFHYSANEAGLAALSYFFDSDVNREYAGKLYFDKGSYSFTSIVMGPPCAPTTDCTVNNTVQVPAGTQEVGSFHTHPFENDWVAFGGDLRVVGYVWGKPEYIQQFPNSTVLLTPTPGAFAWGTYLTQLAHNLPGTRPSTPFPGCQFGGQPIPGGIPSC